MTRIPNPLALAWALAVVSAACDGTQIDPPAQAEQEVDAGLEEASDDIGVSDAEYEKIVAEMRAAEQSGTLDIEVQPITELVEEPALRNKDALLPGQIAHNAVRGFAQNASPFMTTFQPTLKVSGGCVPFPAVQADGLWNGGLQSSGSANGGCSSSPGQVYGRQITVGTVDHHSGARCALFYAWYFPKDGNVTSGHRHDWENIVVWLDRCDDVNARVIAVAYSGHGKYNVHRVYSGSPNGFSGRRPRVKYAQTWPLNFQLFPTFDNGGSQPVIDWWRMTPAARSRLNTAYFGKANVPIKDANWLNNFYAAKFW